MEPNDPNHHETFRNRFSSDVERDREEIQQWLNGPGGIVVFLVLVFIGGYFLYSLVAG